MLSDILKSIGDSPLLAFMGVVLIAALLLAPLSLKLAGLSAAQIVDLLARTMTFVIDVVREFRENNTKPPV